MQMAFTKIIQEKFPFAESVFSQMNDLGTDSRNKFTVSSTVDLIVKTNINPPCHIILEMLANDKAVREKKK